MPRVLTRRLKRRWGVAIGVAATLVAVVGGVAVWKSSRMTHAEKLAEYSGRLDALRSDFRQIAAALPPPRSRVVAGCPGVTAADRPLTQGKADEPPAGWREGIFLVTEKQLLDPAARLEGDLASPPPVLDALQADRPRQSWDDDAPDADYFKGLDSALSARYVAVVRAVQVWPAEVSGPGPKLGYSGGIMDVAIFVADVAAHKVVCSTTARGTLAGGLRHVSYQRGEDPAEILAGQLESDLVRNTLDEASTQVWKLALRYS